MGIQYDRLSREAFKREATDRVLPHILVPHPLYYYLSADYLDNGQRKQFVILLSESAWYFVQRVQYEPAGPIFALRLSICETNAHTLED
jgi:hypothetical protein